MYIQYKVNISENQVDTLIDAIQLKKGVTLCFPKGGIRGDHVLLLAPAQINRLDKAQVEGRCAETILSGFTTGLLSGGINKAISGSGGAVGDGLYLHKHDKCYRVQKCKGNGLYLAPRPLLLKVNCS